MMIGALLTLKRMNVQIVLTLNLVCFAGFLGHLRLGRSFAVIFIFIWCWGRWSKSFTAFHEQNTFSFLLGVTCPIKWNVCQLFIVSTIKVGTLFGSLVSLGSYQIFCFIFDNTGNARVNLQQSSQIFWCVCAWPRLPAKGFLGKEGWRGKGKMNNTDKT